MQLQNKLSVKEHLRAIQKKIDFLNIRLTPVRRVGDLKYSSNLFICFILPLYRLSWPLVRIISEGEREQFFRHLRRNYRKFCCLPYTTPTRVVDLLIGKVELVFNVWENFIRNKTEEWKQSRQNERRATKVKIYKLEKLPKLLHTVLKTEYSNKCQDCR